MGKPKETAAVGSYGDNSEEPIDAGFLFYHTFCGCTSLIGNALSKCSFRTLRKGQPYRGLESYWANLQPNPNQSAAAFWREAVYRLYLDNEALLVEDGGGIYVADGFSRYGDGTAPNRYQVVSVRGVTLPGEYGERDVIHLTLGEQQIYRLNFAMAECYRKILEFTVKSYQKSRGTRLVVEVNAMPHQEATFKEDMEKLFNRDLRRLFDRANAAVPVYRGIKVNELGSKTYSAEGTRDIRAMMEDVTSLMCRSMGIPPKLMAGDIAGIGDAVEQLLTGCIDPLARMIEQEINRKRYTVSDYLEGTGMRIDTKTIRHMGYQNIGALSEKMIANGWSHNELREILREPLVDEPWANQHLFTKNNGLVEQTGKERGNDTAKNEN